LLDKPEERDPEANFAPPDEKATACAVTITTQVGTNRSIVVQTYLARDADINDFHSVFDKLNKVVDRQEAKLQLEELEARLALSQKNLKNMSADFDRIEERAQKAWDDRGKKGAFKLSEAELTQKKQARGLIERTKEEVARLEADISRARGVVADVD
jgi:hypothetical protein